MTYGFYIKSSEDEIEKIRSIFQKFENNRFIKQGSYKILTPKPYPSGEARGYTVVSFEKNGDKYPRAYIRKLRALLNHSTVNGRRIQVNWVSHSVLRDILTNAEKDKKVQS